MRKLVVGIMAAGVLAASSGLLFAYVLLNPPQKWFSVDLPRDWFTNNTHPDPSLPAADQQAAVHRAILAWNDGVTVTADARFTSQQGFDGTDGQSVISFNDPQGLLGAGTLAAATVGFYASGQTETVNGITFFRYLDSDVVFNNGISFTTRNRAILFGCNVAYDMEGIAIQEVGHGMGLDHPNVEQASMYGSLAACDLRKRDLDVDDVNGIRTIYVNGRPLLPRVGGSNLISDSVILGLSTTTKKKASNLYIYVTVQDENKNSIGGASVSVSVMTPGGSILSGTGTTGTSGRIIFNAGRAQLGDYTARVTNITKAGLTFNPNQGLIQNCVKVTSTSTTNC